MVKHQRVEAARIVRKHEAARAEINQAAHDRAAVKNDSMDPQPNLEAWYLRIMRADHDLLVARGHLHTARADAIQLLVQSEDEVAVAAADAYMDAVRTLERELGRLAQPRRLQEPGPLSS